MTSMAFTRGGERKLGRAPASSREDAATAYMACALAHPMGIVRLVTPAEWAALDARAGHDAHAERGR